MKIARPAGIVLGFVCAVAAIVAMGIPAAAAATSNWQITATVHYGPSDNASGYSVVTAPAENDAWVFGGTNPGGASSPTAEHWNGADWRPWPLPAGLSGFIVAADASSAGNVWAVGDGYALRWNGLKWTVAKTWDPAGETTSVAAISPSDVWVFGSSFSGGTGLGTWHYNGRLWIKATGPATAIYRASAISRHDVWAITTGPRGGSVVRYDGLTWRRVSTADAALAGTQLNDVLALSPGNVWVSGVQPTSGANGHLVLAHWDGTRWKRFVAPWEVQQPERFAPDGAGGIWIPVVTGGSTPATWILHLSHARAWTRTRIAAGPGAGVGVGDLALVPGTTTVWGAGGLLTTAGGDAAIWEHGLVTGHLVGRGPAAARYRPAWQEVSIGERGALRAWVAQHRAAPCASAGSYRAGVCSCAAAASSSARSSASSRASIRRRSSIRALVST
jgi:hypothetical protein